MMADIRQRSTDGMHMKIFIRGLYIPGILLVIWLLGSSLHGWNTYIMPSPKTTWDTALRLAFSGILFKHVAASLYRVLAGFLIAFMLAFPLGIVLGMIKKSNSYLYPLLEFIRHVPPLAMIPMLILWFGIGEASKLVVIILAAFFPVFLNTLNGVLNCDRRLLEVGISLDFDPLQQFRRIVLPAAFPYIMAGMQLGLGYSWRALIGAELIAASSGIGYMILDAEQLSRPDIMIVGILTIGIFGSIIDLLFIRAAKMMKLGKAGEASGGWG